MTRNQGSLMNRRRFSQSLLALALGATLGAGTLSPSRSEAAEALRKIQSGDQALGGKNDGPAQALIAADIKRFLERPIDPIRTPTTFDWLWRAAWRVF